MKWKKKEGDISKHGTIYDEEVIYTTIYIRAGQLGTREEMKNVNSRTDK